MQAITLDPGNDYQTLEAAKEAADVLRSGGLVVFPTETVYGVAASALSDEGVDRLRQLKNADNTRAFTVHIPEPKDIGRYAELTGGAAKRLAIKAMPGPITLLVEVTPEVIGARLEALGLADKQSQRLYHDGVVGLRCPAHAVARAVLTFAGVPVIATSANLPRETPPVDARRAEESIGDRVGLVIDAGPSQYAKPSTIVRIAGQGTNQTWSVHREGVYDERYIKKLARLTLLMVCTGNTCRSPMAQGIASQMIQQQLGVEPGGLADVGIDVKSAGAYASAGMPATEEAVLAVAGQGIDIGAHRSTELTRELVDSADVIYCMTAGHLQAVLALSPHAAGKTLTIDPDTDIGDPIGAGQQTYLKTASAIRQALSMRLKELPL
jgi:protein arginine phosphatase